MKLLSESCRPVRRLLAAIIGAQAFCVLASEGGEPVYGYYFGLLAVVYVPVAFVWCNAIRDYSGRVVEGVGWALPLLFLVLGVGSM